MSDPYDDYMEVSDQLQDAERRAAEAASLGTELMKMEAAYQQVESENATLRAERDRLIEALRELVRQYKVLPTGEPMLVMRDFDQAERPHMLFRSHCEAFCAALAALEDQPAPTGDGDGTMTLSEAAKQGYEYVRLPSWDRNTYLRLDVNAGGIRGPWADLYDPAMQKVLGEPTPQKILVIAVDPEEGWVPCDGMSCTDD